MEDRTLEDIEESLKMTCPYCERGTSETAGYSTFTSICGLNICKFCAGTGLRVVHDKTTHLDVWIFDDSNIYLLLDSGHKPPFDWDDANNKCLPKPLKK